MPVVVYVLLIIILWGVCGFLTLDLHRQKGYEGGFFVGFLFGIFGLIYSAEQKGCHFFHCCRLFAVGKIHQKRNFIRAHILKNRILVKKLLIHNELLLLSCK